MKKLIRLLKDEEGVTAMEYGLIAALVACVIIIGVTAAGAQLNALFNGISRVFQAAVGNLPAAS